MSGREIAIIGIGLRFPGGVTTPNELWRLLEDGTDAIVEVPPERWDARRFASQSGEEPGRTYAHMGGFLEQSPYEFDAAFFGLAPREASQLDPQQRLLLQATWEALEDAGQDHERLRRRAVGVFVGGFTLDNMISRLGTLGRDAINSHTATSSTMVMLSNRLSHVFDFVGPSMTVDTACSSSLVAVHLACQSLRHGESEIAVAAGVNVMLRPEYNVSMSKGGFLSRSGRCRAFDARADGYVRGEGVGAVLLKPLDAARSDGDPVYATIRGTGINQDGHTPGISMPNRVSQQALIERVHREAGVRACDVAYVEAHGPGTQAGDPIEAHAIGTTLTSAEREGTLLVGSIKTNIGHTEAAAGIAGLIKTSLVLAHRYVPPNLHFEQPNPAIDLDKLGIEIPTRGMSLPQAGALFAAVNSFGYGGTNAHAVLCTPPEETPRVQPVQSCQSPRPFALAAQEPQALVEAAARLRGRVGEAALEDLGHSLGRRRTHLPERLLVWAASEAELDAALAGFDGTSVPESAARQRAPEQSRRLLCVFTGMGAQYAGMGRSLYEGQQAFRAAIAEVDAHFQSLAGWSLEDFFRGNPVPGLPEEEGGAIEHPALAQPTNFALQVGLMAVLREFGVEPQGFLGHSVGELAAVWAAGALGLEDAVTVMHHRAVVQQALAGQGAMAAVGLAETAARARLEGRDIEIAAVNAPDGVTLSGDRAALTALCEELSNEGLFARMLRVAVAYHSAQLESLGADFMARIADIEPVAPVHTLYSSVNGERVTKVEHDAVYFQRNAREAVRFEQAIQAALADGFDAFLEIGPNQVLSSSIASCARAEDKKVWTGASLKRGVDDLKQWRGALGQAWASGVPMSFDMWFPQGRHVDLPRYPWQPVRMWAEPEGLRSDLSITPIDPLLHRREEEVEPVWQTFLTDRFLPYLGDHVVSEEALFPGAGYIAAALAAARQVEAPLALERVRFERALSVSSGPTLRIRLDERMRSVSLDARAHADEPWRRHATAVLGSEPPRPPQQDAGCGREVAVDVEGFYAALSAAGMAYGPRFRAIRALGCNGDRVVADIQLPDGVAPEGDLHPVLLDACFQALFALTDLSALRPMVPVGVERVEVLAPVGDRVRLTGGLTCRGADYFSADLVLRDPDTGAPCAQVRGLRCQALPDNSRPLLARAAVEEVWVEAPARDQSGVLPVAIVGAGEPAGRLAEALGLRVIDPDQIAAVQGGGRVVWVAPQTIEGGLDDVAVLAELTALVAALADREGELALTVVTSGAHGSARSPGHAALWGLGRVAQNEHPELDVRLVDIGGEVDREAVARLAAEVVAPDAEAEIRLGRHREASRVVPFTAVEAPLGVCRSDEEALTLAVAGGEGVDALVWQRATRRPPGPGEVEIHTTHTSLNFKDVMKVMGMLGAGYLDETYFGDTLGMETAGRIVAVGPDVESFAVGDEVIVPNPGGSFASFTTVPVELMVHRPTPLTLAEAPVFIAYVTAYHGLAEVARLEPGESVLIHGAGGGVGQAAIQVAQMLGARVFATAGTEEKRAQLLEQDVEAAFDSRSLDFAAGVRDATKGRGVDVVLNSLSGEGLRVSWGLLAPYGRFVEIGKRDIEADNPLGLGHFDLNRAFAALDIDRMMKERPMRFRRILDRVHGLLDDGALAPIPVEVFPAADVSEAFRHMARSRHFGKIVVELENQTLDARPDPKAALARGDRAYLVTGGLSGFGREIARWLARQGAGELWLVGRRGMETPGAQALAAELEALGSRVQIDALDLCDEVAVAAAFAARQHDGRLPLAGVFHAAMVLDDGLLAQLSAHSLERVYAPKARGGLLLDRLTRGQPLEHFVLFSSVSALIGNPGQGAYVAANAALGALAHRRRAQGLPALTVDWGVLADTGVVARSEELAGHLEKAGVSGFSSGAAIEVLEQLMRSDAVEVCVADVDWGAWARRVAAGKTPRFSVLAGVSGLDGDDPRVALRETLLELGAEREAHVVGLLAGELAEVLQTSAETLASDRPLDTFGVDSLMAVELAQRVEHRLGVTPPTGLLMRGPSLEELAKFVIGDVLGVDELQEEDVDDLSDEEVEAMLAAMVTEAGDAEILEEVHA